MGQREHIEAIYLEIGRDPSKLKLKNKSDVELTVILEKLKAIRYSFGLLFSEQQGVDLAREILISVFKKDEGRKDGHQ